MGTENQQPSGGMTGLAAQYGITPTMAGGAYGDPDDFIVMTGWSDPPTTAAPLAGDVRRMEATGQVSTPWGERMPNTKRSSELAKQLYSMPDDEVGELQRRLWAGGFYPPGTDPNEVALGDRDPYTDKAWSNAIERAGNFFAAGRKLTLDEVIDMGANLRGGAGIGADGAGGTGRQPLVTELTNPEDLKYYAQRTAVSTLGRPLRADELNRFVSRFHGSQQSSQAQSYNAGGAGGPGGSVVGAPSPTAAAETFARQASPNEAGAHDFVKVYDAFSKMLGGRRQ